MKKRILALVLVLALCAGLLVMPVGAAEPEAVAYLTISVAGKLQLTRYPVTLTDENENGKLDIDDVLQVGHAIYGDDTYSYASARGDYGLSITKLWGDTSGAFGYCVNTTVPMSLEEEVKAGDDVYAYVYQDKTGYTDAFSYFNERHISVTAGDTVTLTLSKLGYGENWETISTPIANAAITIDGEETDYVTDENGKVTMKLNAPGLYVISANVTGTVLVPPVTTARVKATWTKDWRNSAMTALQGTAAISLAKQDENISAWDIIGLYGAGVPVPEAYLADYLEGLYDALVSGNGQLSASQYTAYSRGILALAAVGEDPASFAGYDLLKWLEDYDKTTKQGVTGAAYALLALDCAGDTFQSSQREAYVQYILDAQRKDGGWDLRGESAAAADADVTAICLQALAAYAGDPAVRPAVNKGLDCLSALQQSDGGFKSYGTANCESSAMVLLAMCQLGIGLDDARFVKGESSVLDAMLRFRNADGSFSHEAGKGANTLATMQAQMALASLLRCADGMSGIYDMTDGYGEFPFTDVAFNTWYFEAVRYTNQAGLLVGTTETTFGPNVPLTRGMLVTILWRMMGRPAAQQNVTAYYSDVNAKMYYAEPIAWATELEVAAGMGGGKFCPEEKVTREQLACYLYRYQKLALGGDVSASENLQGWSDYSQISSWSKEALAWATAEGLLVGSGGKLDPKGSATRAQVASVLMRFDRSIGDAWENELLGTYFK